MLHFIIHLFLVLIACCTTGSLCLTPEEEDLVPLVMWPGMGDSCCYVFGAAGYQGVIQRMVPNMYIKIIAFGHTPQEDSYNSFFLNANTQVELACQLLSSDPKLKNGFNAMGFSQGAQFLRALVQRCDKVTVFNLISVGGQHQGVYGFPFCMGEESWYCDLFRQFLSIGVYLTIFQDYLVQASYWHDPHDEESYQLDSLFLSDINQEVKFNPLYKKRLSKLSNFVLIKFEQDMMVQPRETEWFGFYKPGQAIEIYSLFESRIFTQDLLGLQYLNNTGRLHLLSSPNGHTLLTYDWLDNYVIPYIKRNYTNVHQPVNLAIKKGMYDMYNKYTSITSAQSSKKIIAIINQPQSIHITSNGTIFISGYGDKLIHQFDPIGNLIRTIGPIKGENGAHGITVFGDWLYVANSNSVYRYSLVTGQYSRTLYQTNDNGTEGSLHGVSVDGQGLLYISHNHEGLIHVVTEDGHHLKDLAIGCSPQKIQFDSEGNIRVIDTRDRNIYVLTKYNHLLHTYPTNLISPHGLFVDRNNNMIVADKEGGVTVYDNNGHVLHVISGFDGCNDVYVSPNGTLWVSETKANHVHLFQL